MKRVWKKPGSVCLALCLVLSLLPAGVDAFQVSAYALSDATRQVVGDRPVYDFSITVGDKTISQFDETATLSLSYTPPATSPTLETPTTPAIWRRQSGLASQTAWALTNFVPHQAVTRQEMFTRLYNALKVIDLLPMATTTRAQMAQVLYYLLEK